MSDGDLEGAQSAAPSAQWLPIDVDKVDMVFGVGTARLMPDYADIPAEFKRAHGKWCDFASTWFFKGLKGASFEPREGIDPAKALRHLRTIIGSFEPKHEHKEAAVAYLASLWFTDWTPSASVSTPAGRQP